MRYEELIDIKNSIKHAYRNISPQSDPEYLNMRNDLEGKLKEKIFELLRSLSFDRKVEWMKENQSLIEENDFDFELCNEDFFAYSFAVQQKSNPNITREYVIDLQIAHLEDLIRKWERGYYDANPNHNPGDTIRGDNASHYLHRQRLLTYFKSLKEKEPEQVQISGKVVENEHDEAFKNNGFKLFNYILNNYVEEKGQKGRISSISFFYRKMYDGEYIRLKVKPFIEWFFKTYGEDLGKIQSLHRVNTFDRGRHYSNSLNWFKAKR